MSETKLNPSTLPAGHQREEAKKLVTDQLEEQAASAESVGINPDLLDHTKVENEIVQHLNDSGEFEVPGAQPDYFQVLEVRNVMGQTVGTVIDYCGYEWIAKRHQDQAEIKGRVRRLLGPGHEGYVRVDSSMPEYKAAKREGMVDAEGNVYVGDCILYRVHKDIALKIRAIMSDKAVQPLLNPEDAVLARAQRHGHRNVRARVLDVAPGADSSMVQNLAMTEIARRAKTGENIGPLTPQNAARLGRR